MGNNSVCYKIFADAMDRADMPCENTAERDIAILDCMQKELCQYAAIPVTKENIWENTVYHTEFSCALMRFLINLKQLGLSTALEYLSESACQIEIYRADRLEALLCTLEEAKKWVSFREENH